VKVINYALFRIRKCYKLDNEITRAEQQCFWQLNCTKDSTINYKIIVWGNDSCKSRGVVQVVLAGHIFNHYLWGLKGELYGWFTGWLYCWPLYSLSLDLQLSFPALASFKKYMPPPLPYFKVNICRLPLPHFASTFFAYLWSFRWPNYIATLPRYFSFRLTSR
jgi:hypothetical protein